MNSRCDEIYRSVIELDTRSRTNLFDLAQCFIDGFELDNLRRMLESEDLGVVSDGLFVLGEIGSLARGFASEIRLLTQCSDDEIRRSATKLASMYGIELGET